MDFIISNSKKQIIESIINDNRDNILNYHDGVVAGYFIAELQMNDRAYTDILTDDQIEYYENLTPSAKSYYFWQILKFFQNEYNYKLN